MTIVAWDGKTLAADKRAENAGLSRTVTKIFRIDNLLVGVAWNLCAGLEMIEWVKNGRKPSDFPEIQRDKNERSNFLVIENGKLLVYETSPQPIIFEDEFFAFGSGRDYALAAMACGKSAKEAVEIACMFDTGCGNGIDVLVVGDNQ